MNFRSLVQTCMRGQWGWCPRLIAIAFECESCCFMITACTCRHGDLSSLASSPAAHTFRSNATALFADKIFTHVMTRGCATWVRCFLQSLACKLTLSCRYRTEALTTLQLNCRLW